MKKLVSCIAFSVSLFLLFVSCVENLNNTVEKEFTSAGYISAKFNGKLKMFKYLTNGKLANSGELLTINGFLENNTQSPTLEVHVKKVKGKISIGSYHLDSNQNLHIDIRYTINRAQDGALLSNTFYETRVVGNRNDLLINITSVGNGRVRGTFSGVITKDEEVKGDQLITLTEGKFDVGLD